MIFSRIIYSALAVGVLCGLLLSAMQITAVDPIIFEAESYEIAEPEGAAESPEADDGHGHSHDGWGPEDGAERTFYTFLSNIFAAIGFAAVMLALMSQFVRGETDNMNWSRGLVWGLAGFVAVYVAPAIGLHPEIPGIEAPPVEYRQAWWVLTVACVSIGIGFLAFARGRRKVPGLVLIAVPYLVGAPAHEGPAFAHPDPSAVTTLTALHQNFIVASAITNLVFWLALGVVSAMVYRRCFSATAESERHT